MSKKIFADLSYVADKIKEAIFNHNKDGTSHQDVREQINVLSSDRGYLDTKDISGTDINLLRKNGKYWGANLLNNPLGGMFASIDVIEQGYYSIQNIVTQNSQIIRFYDTSSSSWNYRNIATTDKIDILATPNAGYTLFFQKNYQINNTVYYNIRIVGNFVGSTTHVTLSVPTGKSNDCALTGTGYSNNWEVGCVCMFAGSNLLITPTKSCTEIIVSGVVVL